ncbi:unnamed protein product [Paramecium sonneborni]|uniref:Uncharacterized protein n=1 Tax=Paramecium sonneborni TaxID=65129 RepID=A0A8S1LQK4_9CILI|nr:unnamed protein product [Paramecium sonneborni]
MLKKQIILLIENSSIISIKGKEAFEILQLITINEICQIQQAPTKFLLSTNRRVIFEAILHRPQMQDIIFINQKKSIWQYSYDEISLDIDRDFQSSIVNHNKKFLIRKKFKLQTMKITFISSKYMQSIFFQYLRFQIYSKQSERRIYY